MELKEYYKILKNNIAIIIYTVIIAVVIVYAWSVRQSQVYRASMILNISRTENQNTADYRYDQFYRLQADEKFSETIVEWLKAPGVARDIFQKADISSDQKTMRQLAKSFRAEKVSSNIVSIDYSTLRPNEAEKISSAIETVISEKTKKMNASAQDPDWFQVEISNLVILQNRQNLIVNLGIAAIAGLFIGSLFALGKHYISE